jgi:hypothetical protein
VSTTNSSSRYRPFLCISSNACAKSSAAISSESWNLRNSSPPWPVMYSSTLDSLVLGSVCDGGTPGGCRPVSTRRKFSTFTSGPR